MNEYRAYVIKSLKKVRRSIETATDLDELAQFCAELVRLDSARRALDITQAEMDGVDDE